MEYVCQSLNFKLCTYNYLTDIQMSDSGEQVFDSTKSVPSSSEEFIPTGKAIHDSWFKK